MLVPHVAPHEKAETAEHDERHQRNVHERILRPADERLKRIVRCAHQVKACVAECRNRVEHAHCDSLRETVMRHEPAGQQNRSRPFDDERAEQHAPCQTDNAAAVRQIKPRAHHHALVQRDRSPQDKRRNSRDGHKAESADLNQQQDDALAEYRPVHCRADRDESGNTARRGCCKQRVEKRRYLSVCRRNRQHQYQRTHQNRQCKADGKHRRRPHSQMPLMRRKNLRLHDKSPPLTMIR